MLTDGSRKGPRLHAVIRSGWLIEDGMGLYWSNEMGWVDKASADKFTEEDIKTVSLPMGGKWISAQRAHEQRIDSIRNHPSTWADEKPELKIEGGGATK